MLADSLVISVRGIDTPTICLLAVDAPRTTFECSTTPRRQIASVPAHRDDPPVGRAAAGPSAEIDFRCSALAPLRDFQPDAGWSRPAAGGSLTSRAKQNGG